MGAGRRTKVTFQRLWWEPLAWVMSKYQWTQSSATTDKPQAKRACVVSFLEMACLVDLLTGGCFGPVNASFAEKIALVKYGSLRLLKVAVTKGTDGEQKGTRFLKAQPKVPSCEPSGLANLGGFDRRPCFGEDTRLVKAIGSMVCYAGLHGTGCTSRT